MKRPMINWVILFVLGELVGRLDGKTVALVIGILGILFLLCRKRIIRNKKDTLVYLQGVVFFLFGIVCMTMTIRKIEYCQFCYEKQTMICGKICRKEITNSGIRYVLRCNRFNNQTIHVNMMLEWEEELSVGDQIGIEGVIYSFSKATNYGAFDEEVYRFGNGIYAKIKPEKIIYIKTNRYSLLHFLDQIKTRIQETYYSYFDEANASLACAMVLGEKQTLDQDKKSLYQKNGISHLIAISGLHIAMIGGAIYQMLRKWTGSYPLSAGIGVVFIVLYGVLTGLAGTTVRAMIMLIVMYGADVFGRKYDVLSAVALALFVMVMMTPFAIEQAGFLLSFGAVLGIAWIKPMLNSCFDKIPKWLDGFIISVSVEIMTLPILLYFYYKVPVWGILLNIIVVPLMSILLGALIGCAVMGPFFATGAQLFASICNGIFRLYEVLCFGSERLPFHTICSGKPKTSFIVIYYVLLAMVLLYIHNRCEGIRQKRRAAAMYGILLTALLVVGFYSPSLKICMMDVGQGDCFFLQLPNQMNILVDGGSSSKRKIGKNIMTPGIQYFGGLAIDYVFLSHSDSDHYSGICELLENNEIPIYHLVLPQIKNPDEAYMNIVSMAKQRNVTLHYMKQDDILSIGDVNFQCLSPKAVEVSDKNAGSLVLWLNYKNFDMLFTGDLDSETEKILMYDNRRLPGGYEVLKVAHHGSGGSTSKEFLEWVNPRITLVSVGKNNRYGHPAKEVMERIAQTSVYRTDENGAVLLTTNGKKLRMESFTNK